MKDRIKQIRKNLKMNQTEFGAEIGATQKMITTYETGTVIPDKTTRLLICSKFNVNENWLETGEGVPYNRGLTSSLEHALRHMPDVKAMLEAKLPYVSDETFEKMNEAFKRFLDEIK
jgi:transcriptional regulator with XRE-family HTH domain